jgi:hypothetical protein
VSGDDALTPDEQRIPKPHESRVVQGILPLIDAAAKTCLDGRDPVSNDDWCAVLNYVALNVDEPAARVMDMMRAVWRYSGLPWTEEYLRDVLECQAAERYRLGLPPRQESAPALSGPAGLN